MANWSNPQLTSTYTDFMNQLKDRDTDLALQFDGTTSSNLTTGTIRWNSSINRWQKWSGSSWGELTSTYGLTGLSTTGNASIGGTLTVTGSTSLAAATATTPATADNSTAIATTAWVRAQNYSGATTGTSANTPNTLVQRDASGNFAAGALTLGSFSASNACTVPSGTAASPGISAGLGGLFSGIGSFAYTSLSFNGAEVFRVGYNGQIGVGFATPSYGSSGQVLTSRGSGLGAQWTWPVTIASASEVDGVHTTGTVNAGSTSLTVASATGITVAMAIVGEGIPPGTTVSSIAGTTVTMSQALDVNAVSLSADPVSFYATEKALSPGSTGGRLARAWVNFRGTSTVAIRAAYNLTSISDNGIGTYTLNFTTAMPDTNYCVVTGTRISSSTSALTANSACHAVTYNTGSVLVHTGRTSANQCDDHEFVNVAIFR